MAKVDVNRDKGAVITEGFIDKLLDKIGRILKDQYTLFERDSEKQESIELLLEKVGLIENNFEELSKSLAKGSYPLKLARSVRVTESLVPPKIEAVNISKSQLIATYNEIVALLSDYVIPVTLTPDSYRDLNQGRIFLETSIKGNYWVITTIEKKQHKYWLVPNSNLNFNIHKLKTVKTLFQLKGDYNSPTNEFILQEPAILSLLPNNKQWKLIQPGVLFFGKNFKSVSSQSKLSRNETDDNQSKINNQMLSSLKAFDTTVQQLNNKVLILEKQLEISQTIVEHNTEVKRTISYNVNNGYERNFELQEGSLYDKTGDRESPEIIGTKVDTKPEANSNGSYHSFYRLIRDGKLEVTQVAVLQETMEKIRSGTLSKLQFSNDKKGNFWIINWHNVHCLIPKKKININQYQYGNFQRIFNCQDYQETYSDFEVIEPAIVFNCDGETWQLSRKGKIKFI